MLCRRNKTADTGLGRYKMSGTGTGRYATVAAGPGRHEAPGGVARGVRPEWANPASHS